MTLVGTTGEFSNAYQEVRGEWKIADFFSLSENKNFYNESPTFTFMETSYCLRIYAGGHENAKDGFIALFLFRKSGLPRTLVYAFGIKKADGKVERILHNRTCKFKQTNLGYGSLNFFERSELLRRKSELAPLDALTITCNLHHGSVLYIADEVDMKLTDLKTLSKNFEDLLSNEKNCDTTLRVKNKEFQVHKSVLVARSSVFAAMFQHDMLEKETGIISIEDCDPDSFGYFLQYLYSGKAENISFKRAFNMYSIADKYDVQELKYFCIEYMEQNLTVENVCDAVTLADQYDEISLMNTAQRFFNKNLNKIAVTTEWGVFLAKKPRLANKLIIEMSSKVKIEM